MSLTRSTNKRGFTLMEMLLAVLAFCIIMAIVLLAAARQQAMRRDVTRTATIKQLQSALALFVGDQQSYPVGTGCITGTDKVSMQLIAKKLIDLGAKVADPKSPDDAANCFWYESDGSTYSLRYVLETDSVQPKGEHTTVP